MIVILTALDVECAAVRVHLTGLRTHHHAAGTVFEVGQLTALPSRTVALASIGMGTANAAAITAQAITEFRPRAVMFVGIAGGLREWTRLGDIVVATRVYAYHGGRAERDEFLAHPRAWDTSHRLVQLAKQVNRSKAWPDASDTSPAVHFEPLAAGEVVLDSLSSPEGERLRSHYNDAVAVEMESAGVALAAHLHESTPMIVIRAISDLADGIKHDAEKGGWRALAARNAAAFSVGLVAAIDDNSASAGQAVHGAVEHQKSGPINTEPRRINQTVKRGANVAIGGDARNLTVAGRDVNKTNKFHLGTGGWIVAAVLILTGGTVGVVAGTSGSNLSEIGVRTPPNVGVPGDAGPVGPNASPGQPVWVLKDEFSYSHDNYPYRASFEVNFTAPSKDVSNSAPGYAEFGFGVAGKLTITNLLTDRNAPTSPRPTTVFAWWPISSPICQVGLFAPASVAQKGDRNNPAYCAGMIADGLDFSVTTLSPGGSNSFDVGPGFNTGFVPGKFQVRIRESDYDALAQAFSAGPASWGWAGGGFGGQCPANQSGLVWVHDNTVVSKDTCDLH